MPAIEHFDAIVVGAGPAGLAIGSDLSDDYKVLVIDRKSHAEKTTRSWFVPEFTITEGGARELLDPSKGIVFRDDPRQLKPNGVNTFLTKTFATAPKHWPARLAGGYPFLDETALLGYWAGLLGANEARTGSKLLLNTLYLDHDVSVMPPPRGGSPRKYVTVRTTEGTFRSDLLIDATGHESLIRTKHGFRNKDFFWWSVYGALVDHPRGLGVDEASGRRLRMGDYLLWGTYRDTNPDLDASLSAGRPVLEYEVLWENRKDAQGKAMPPRSFVFILYLRNRKVPVDVMKAEFDHVLYHEKTTSAFHETDLVEPKWGYYPSGGISQNAAADHVAFVGDAGCWSTPCGWGMGFIMRNYKTYSRKLKRALQANQVKHLNRDPLSAEVLRSFVRLGVHDWNQMILDRVATRFLSHAPAHAIDDFIRIWGDGPGQVPFLVCERLFTLTISHAEAVQVARALIDRVGLEPLIALFPPKEFKTLLTLPVSFAADAVATAIQRRTSLFQNYLPAFNRSGFDFE